MVRFPGSAQANFDNSSLQTTQAAAAPFDRIRFLAIMADGSKYELNRPLDVPPSEDADAYIPIAFPPRRPRQSGGQAARRRRLEACEPGDRGRQNTPSSISAR